MIRKPTERRRFLAAAVNSIQGVIGGPLGVLLGGAVFGSASRMALRKPSNVTLFFW
jgi:hypothetical protein